MLEAVINVCGLSSAASQNLTRKRGLRTKFLFLQFSTNVAFLSIPRFFELARPGASRPYLYRGG